MSRRYGIFYFSETLSAAPRAEKEQALSSLEDYLTKSFNFVSREEFRSVVKEFEQETKGLDSPTRAEIFRLDLPLLHCKRIASLGFRVEPIAGGRCDF